MMIVYNLGNFAVDLLVLLIRKNTTQVVQVIYDL